MMQEGLCRLCNKTDKLTFEHVPPRVTFNKQTKYKSMNMLEYLKEKNPLKAKLKGKTEQGGIGYYSLCRKCNSFLGRNYVPDFQKYSNSFIEFAKKKEFNYFEITIHDFSALNVLKQIVSMFITINSEEFSANNRDLSEFVLDKGSKNLPSRCRVFNYLNTEGQLRYLPISVLGDLRMNSTVVASEIAFPPLGHVITFDFNGKLPFHQEITSFKDFDTFEKPTIDYKIYRLPTYLPFLLDYRDKASIEGVIEKGK